MDGCSNLKLFTLDEVATFLRVHRATVSRLVKSGELPCCSIGTRRLVREQDLHAFVENRIGVVAGSRDAGGGVHG